MAVDAFDIFGVIDADTGKFQSKLRTLDSGLKSTDAQLNKVISTSNKLGDTSATVARRYEKLGEGIAATNLKLQQSTQAYLAGEINAKKYSSALAQVERQTASLSSRLKDAKARATELSETNLTHFQNQISGAVSASASGHGGSIIDLNRARPLMGIGAAFQATGLRQYGLDETVLNVLIVAARSAGIIKTETVATAAAETAFATASTAAAGSQAAVAAESEATAAAMTQASTVTTVFGATLLTIGATLVAAAAAIGAAWKLSKDIREESEKRLKGEEAITAELNKQNLALQGFKDRLADEAQVRFDKKRDFSALKKEYDDVAQSAAAAFNDRLDTANRAGMTGEQRTKVVGSILTDAQAKRQQELIDEMSSRYADAANNTGKSSADLIKDVQDRQLQAVKDQEEAQDKAQKKASEAAKKMAEEAIRKAKEWAEAVKQARSVVIESFINTSDNPFAKITDNFEKFSERIRNTIGLTAELKQQLINLGQIKADTERFKQSIDNRLQALGLRDQAKEFTQGYLESDKYKRYQQAIEAQQDPYVKAQMERNLQLAQNRDLQQHLQDRLNVLNQDGHYENRLLGRDRQGNERYGQIFIGPNTQEKAAMDKAIIAATQGLDPSRLTRDQNQIAADARQREATRLEKQESDAKALNDALQDALKNGFKVKVVDGKDFVTIRDETNGSIKHTKQPTPAATSARY